MAKLGVGAKSPAKSVASRTVPHAKVGAEGGEEGQETPIPTLDQIRGKFIINA